MPDMNLHNVIASFVFPGVASLAWHLGAWVIAKALRHAP